MKRGVLQRHDRCAVLDRAALDRRQRVLDRGLAPEVGLTPGDPEEAAVKRTLCRFAAETGVLASHEKLGAASPFVVVPAEDAAARVVEPATADAAVEPYRRLGLTVVRAAASGSARLKSLPTGAGMAI